VAASCKWQWQRVADNGGREREREGQMAGRESIDLNQKFQNLT